jgi:hypothetical protein
MGESKRARVRRAKVIEDLLVPNSSFGVCVVALAEKHREKPANWLADRIKAAGGKCTPRHANRIISGKRRVSARALHVLSAAVLD